MYTRVPYVENVLEYVADAVTVPFSGSGSDVTVIELGGCNWNSSPYT